VWFYPEKNWTEQISVSTSPQYTVMMYWLKWRISPPLSLLSVTEINNVKRHAYLQSTTDLFKTITTDEDSCKYISVKTSMEAYCHLLIWTRSAFWKASKTSLSRWSALIKLLTLNWLMDMCCCFTVLCVSRMYVYLVYDYDFLSFFLHWSVCVGLMWFCFHCVCVSVSIGKWCYMAMKIQPSC